MQWYMVQATGTYYNGILAQDSDVICFYGTSGQTPVQHCQGDTVNVYGVFSTAFNLGCPSPRTQPIQFWTGGSTCPASTSAATSGAAQTYTVYVQAANANAGMDFYFLDNYNAQPTPHPLNVYGSTASNNRLTIWRNPSKASLWRIPKLGSVSNSFCSRFISENLHLRRSVHRHRDFHFDDNDDEYDYGDGANDDNDHLHINPSVNGPVDLSLHRSHHQRATCRDGDGDSGAFHRSLGRSLDDHATCSDGDGDSGAFHRGLGRSLDDHATGRDGDGHSGAFHRGLRRSLDDHTTGRDGDGDARGRAFHRLVDRHRDGNAGGPDGRAFHRLVDSDSTGHDRNVYPGGSRQSDGHAYDDHGLDHDGYDDPHCHLLRCGRRIWKGMGQLVNGILAVYLD
ncbi:hypothetical protein HKX48_008011 [Thoreauomyces humboldtii]|nr:hypothetical protein HKX48_008011 [Thoreauomyces humboldtii]